MEKNEICNSPNGSTYEKDYKLEYDGGWLIDVTTRCIKRCFGESFRTYSTVCKKAVIKIIKANRND